MADDGTRSNFARKVDERYAQIPPAAVDPESEWLLFQTAIINAATEACGVKTLGSQHGEKRTVWWSEDVRSVVGKKKAAYHKWIHNQTPEKWTKYTEQWDNTKNVVAEANKKSWEEFGLQLETDHHTANKVFWQTIRRLRKGGQQSIRAMKDSSGKILTKEGDIPKRWQEYFAEMYNPMAGGQGTQAGHAADGSNQLSMAEATTAMKSLRSDKAAGIDEIRPEMLKALSPCGTQWLTRICNVVWRTVKAPKDRQTGIVIPIFKKGDQRHCSNYRGITLLSLPGKIFARVIERRCREIVESQIQGTQCGFRAGRGTIDQIFTLQQAMEKSWEYNKPVYAAFIDLEKDYGIREQLLSAIQSLYTDCRSCVRRNGSKSDCFQVRIGLRQGCVLSPLLFTVCMDSISRRGDNPACIEVGDVKVNSRLFADDVVRVASTADGLQGALHQLALACNASGMKINTSKADVMALSREPKQLNLHVNGNQLNQV